MNILFNSNLLTYKEPKIIKNDDLFYSFRCQLDNYQVPHSISNLSYTEEEYKEELFKLKAIIDYTAKNNDYLVVDYNNKNFQIFENDKFLFTDKLPNKNYVHYGMIKALTHNNEVSKVNRYFELANFEHLSGRNISVINLDEVNLIDSLIQFSKKVNSDLWIKSTKPKSFIKKVILNDINLLPNDINNILDIIYDAQLHSEYILSSNRTVKKEYRFFIINNEIVSYSLKDEKLTPFSEAEFVPSNVINFAKYAIMNIKDELSMPYVLDIAIDINNQPFLMELNPLRNSGLYKTDPYKIQEKYLEKYRK